MKCNQNIERVLEFIFLVVQTTRKSECKRTDASTEKLDTWHNIKIVMKPRKQRQHNIFKLNLSNLVIQSYNMETEE